MSERRTGLPVGPSILLSVATVVLAAVTLDRPEAHTPALAVGAGTAAPPPDPSDDPSAVPESAAPAEGSDATRPQPPAPAVREAGTLSGDPPRTRRRSFAAAEPGETLAEAARRLYGTADAVGILLDANRDVVRSADAPLPQGTFLRTP